MTSTTYEHDRVPPRADYTGIGPGRRTLAEELHLQLADEIVRGVLVPGSALDEMELARRFRVSRTPVREAIRQLSANGLIEARAHRGAVVARPSETRLAEMFETMAELEALCAKLAAERMTGAERRALEAAHETLRASDPCRRSAALSRVQRGLSRRDLCRRAQLLSHRDHAHDPVPGAAVPPRPVSQSWPASQISRRARAGRERDPARQSGAGGERHARPHHDGARRIRALRRVALKLRYFPWLAT